ncbi:AraC family transcriptional regulator [Leptothoe sp. LEGE 181152]|nr:AraC family transcriptional regulator [Leptothoe sp. LEGE 181152]
MAIKLTCDDFREMELQAQQQGDQIQQPLDLGARINLPEQIGVGGDFNLRLRNKLTLTIRHAQLKHAVQHIAQHESNFPLVAKFYLSGASRIRTLDATDIAPDYEEIKGHHYLYHLPNHTEVEEWSTGPVQVVYICADPSYFSTFDIGKAAVSPSLQKLLEGDRTERFHQSLGEITPTIKQLLQQILHCPYTGLMQQIYLESKALELFAAQFALWTEGAMSAPAILLCPQDIEQLHQAKEILIQQATQPPSLTDLARQVGLNNRKLNRGFRQLFGTTVFDYLQNHRLQQARELLSNSRLTIAGVASAIGYKSPEAFSTAFRRKFAVSPKTYQLSQRSCSDG